MANQRRSRPEPVTRQQRHHAQAVDQMIREGLIEETPGGWVLRGPPEQVLSRGRTIIHRLEEEDDARS